jgi:agmatine deiminase
VSGIDALPRGVRMPAETDRHERTLMSWPTEPRVPTLWHDQLDAARDTYATLARAIIEYEPVTMVTDPSDIDDAHRRCGDAVEIFPCRIDDSWIRDNGPIFVRAPDGTRIAAHFDFNAWGNKFPDFACDAAAAAPIAEHLGVPSFHLPFVLEGGSIAVNGAGMLVTTERCLLNPNRNPGRNRVQIEHLLGGTLGIDEFVWLGDAIAEDDGTDGHVDNVVAFCAERRVLLQGCADNANPNAAIARENRARLEAAGLEIVDIPVLPYAEIDGSRVPVPYCNVYGGNGFVAVPVCGHAADDEMLARIGDAYPGRAVLPMPGAVIAYGGGGVHCITQQVPA